MLPISQDVIFASQFVSLKYIKFEIRVCGFNHATILGCFYTTLLILLLDPRYDQN